MTEAKGLRLNPGEELISNQPLSIPDDLPPGVDETANEMADRLNRSTTGKWCNVRVITPAYTPGPNPLPLLDYGAVVGRRRPQARTRSRVAH